MLFMVSTRPKAGATREQLIEHLTRRISPATWDLIRDGVLSHVLYKVGDEPGFFAVVNAPSGKEAKTIVDAGAERLELFDFEISISAFCLTFSRSKLHPGRCVAWQRSPGGGR